MNRRTARRLAELSVDRVLVASMALRSHLPKEHGWPRFVIIGAQRSGTTSMYSYLSAHPGVAASPRKEVHFLTNHWDRGVDWYRAHFPQADEHAVSGEASPYYLLHPHAPSRAAEVLPSDTTFVAMLRNPVNRAYSHWVHMTNKGRETLPFEAALEAEAVRTDDEWERLVADPDHRSPAVQHFSYLRRGHYLPQLERWAAAVGRERLHVLDTDEFFRDPQLVYGQMLDLVDLAPHELEQYPTRNTYPSAPIRDETAAWLRAYYADSNAALAAWLGGDRLSWLDA